MEDLFNCLFYLNPDRSPSGNCLGEVGVGGKPLQSGVSFFYGWHIVAVGFLSHLASTFSLSSTLSVFVKPLTEDLAVSRGFFSLLRTGEILISGVFAPFVGPLVDRYGARWPMTIGAMVMGIGFIFLSRIKEFWQFALVRWSLVTPGESLMGYMVVNVAISRWFIQKRGRAIALSSMGTGMAKVGMPMFAASLFVWLGWRQTWAIFGILTLALVVGPAVIFMRRSPQEMGLQPDIDLRKATMLMFLIQTLGLSLAMATTRLAPLYAGFFLYGIGLGGSQVLQEVIWAGFFGRLSLGRVRGLGLVITNFFAAGGPPFLGFLFDATKSYFTSFALFTVALIISAFLILLVRPPQK